MRPSEEEDGGGGWLTIKNHGVEISIAGGVEEMVRAHPLGGLLFFCFCLTLVLYFV